MKVLRLVSCIAVLQLASGVTTIGQEGVAGTWRVDDAGAGFVLYHSAECGVMTPEQFRVPALILKPGKNNPDAVHQNLDDQKRANAVVVPWISAVLRLRLSPDSPTLRPVSDSADWFGDTASGEVAPQANFPGVRDTASWLPDELSARGWGSNRESVLPASGRQRTPCF